ncbi:MAG: MerR family transcriptional regulator [Deferrisomatales bacterium]
MARRARVGAPGAPMALSIGELARRTGLTPRTIRYYEDLGLLGSVARVEGGRRVYTEEDLRRLKFVRRLKILGLTLDEMRELEEVYQTHRRNDQVLPRLLELLDSHLANLDSRIEQLKILRQDIEAYRHHIRQKL